MNTDKLIVQVLVLLIVKLHSLIVVIVQKIFGLVKILKISPFKKWLIGILTIVVLLAQKITLILNTMP